MVVTKDMLQPCGKVGKLDVVLAQQLASADLFLREVAAIAIGVASKTLILFYKHARAMYFLLVCSS